MDGLLVVEVELALAVVGTTQLATVLAVLIQQPVVDHMQVPDRLIMPTLDILQITLLLPTLVVVVVQDEVVELLWVVMVDLVLLSFDIKLDLFKHLEAVQRVQLVDQLPNIIIK
jgi:hypothetical protein